jgi:hypothetical protein
MPGKKFAVRSIALVICLIFVVAAFLAGDLVGGQKNLSYNDALFKAFMICAGLDFVLAPLLRVITNNFE